MSSFGISGTNAHVVLEEAPGRAGCGAVADDGSGAVPWVLSAKSEPALRAQAARLRAHVDARPELRPVDVGWSLAMGRARLAHRAVIAGSDRAALLAGLDAVAAGEPSETVAEGRVRADGGIAFVFPGQGAQWPGMALDLWDAAPLFAERMQACSEALSPFVEWDLRDLLRGAAGAPALERMDVVQPASFAVFVSLAALWRSYGVEPTAVLGHSQGEIAAAHVGGALSLEDAARVVALRSRALVELSGFGGMMSVFLPAAEVQARIERWGGRISLASFNGPRLTVVSGEPEALRELLAACESDGVRARLIAVDYASHSPQVDAIRERLLEDLAPIAPMAGTIPIYSTTTAARIDGATMDAEHWFRNLREPVRFEQTTRALVEGGVRTFIESSPHPVLTWAVQETVDDASADPDDVAVVGSLRREEGTLERFLTSAGEAHVHGVHVDWEVAFAGRGPRRVTLPTYAFERTRYWLERRQASGGGAVALPAAGLDSAEHPLLGAAVALAGQDSWLCTGRLSLETQPWLADHELLDEVLLPASAFAEVVLDAGGRAGCDTLDELTIEAPLMLRRHRGVRLQAIVGEPDAAGRRAVDVHARADAGDADWVRHATGTVSAAAPAPHDELGAWPPPSAAALDPDALYDRLAGRGFAYGPAFQGVRAAWQGDGALYAEVALGEEQLADAARFAVHPALLDAALHVAAAQGDGVRLAFSWSGVRVQRRGATALRVRIVPSGDDVLRVTAADEHGNQVLSVDALVTRPAGAARDSDALFRVRWAPLPAGSDGGAGPASVEPFADLAAVFGAGGAPAAVVPVAAPAGVAAALALAHDWLADERLRDSALALVTRGAVAAASGEAPDPDAAAVWGLVRSAQSEHPGRLLLIDADGGDGLALALAAGEPQTALRDGAVLIPRLVRVAGDELPQGAWRLGVERSGAPIGAGPAGGDGDRPLGAGEVRVAVRAAGVGATDVRAALGVGGGSLGSEAAGVVVEVGAGVEAIAGGDRVMGFMADAFSPLAVADARLLAPVPEGWSSVRAATVPVAYCTARRALAGLAPGERVLVHAASGGAGFAAIALARRIGAEVFATASRSGWDALRALGLDDEHLATPADFADRVGSVDLVVGALSGELADASLPLLAARGGRFAELGASADRDPLTVAAAHPGVTYDVVDLLAGGPEALGADLRELVAGELPPLPVHAWDVRQGLDALAFAGRARHVGKVVLTVPRAPDPGGTVLITGGTAGLGAVVARHLAAEHGVRNLLLVSRRGRDAPGAAELEAELAGQGCHVTIAACDVGDRAAVAELLSAIAAERPLTAVVHAAGTFENAMVQSLGAGALQRVMRPKADGARWLDELTADLDLTAFVLFSSVAGTLGHPGQGNYAAANAYLDALAQRRRAAGRPATSIAWGLWDQASGMIGELRALDVEQLEATGERVLSTEQGLGLLDAALGHREPVLVAVPLDLAVLRSQARAGLLPAMLRELVRAPARRAAAAGGSLAQQLAAAAEDERDALVLTLVRAQAAAALGHASADDVAPERPFKELGFDSLGSVVLRNRLARVTGLRLPSTLVFDHPTPVAMARFLRAQAEGDGQPEAPAPEPEPQAPPLSPAPSTNGALARLHAELEPAPSAAVGERRYVGTVLGTAASAVRRARFQAWILQTRARLARLGCRFVVEADGTPRFDDLPHIAIDRIGDGRGSLTLRIGRDCRLGRDLTLDLWTHVDAVIEIGERCHFQNRIRLQPWGGAIRLGALVQVRDGAELKSKGEFVVGESTIIGRNVTIHCHERIELGDRVGLAEGVTIMDSDRTHDGSDEHVARQPVVSSPVLVESNVFVGTNALILRGSHVGRNGMIATGAVLTGGEYPAGHLLAGVPASAVRPLAPADVSS